MNLWTFLACGLSSAYERREGRARKSQTDGLGRLTNVWEDPGGLNYQTIYQYDVMGNMLCVEQHGSAATGTGCSSAPSNDATSPWRVRRFTYNSLSQLLTASNPESGTITYAYDNDGNVATKTAPAPNQTGTATVTTTYGYDALNRLTGKSYNDGKTLPVDYAYDGNTLSGCPAQPPPGDTDSYPVGRRTSMCDASGATNWIHDVMGRIKSERRTIGAAAGKFDTDVYNLDGSIANLTVPGYSIAYTYSRAQRPLTATNFNTPETKFVTAASYAPFGGVTSATWGAGTTAITITDSYNSRLQPTTLSAATSAATIMSLSYDFHLGTADNGNVFKITNNRDGNRTQNFLYDSLNRISQAYTNGPNWGETFGPATTAPGTQPTSAGIDAWGNLTNRSAVTGKNTYEPLSTSATVQNRLTGYGYDAAGNMTSNGSASYVYDAENRLIATGGMSYLYDGDGKRVKKCTQGTTPGTCATNATGTLYWMGWTDNVGAESDLTGSVTENYIFFNGQRIARRDASTGAVHYYFSDHLGTHSLVTDANGTMPPQEESDFYPFGGEIPVSGSDTNHYKFTGKERDSESGLDDFDARFYASALGRFMQPDWSDTAEPVAYANFENPQTLSLYSYVLNNPTGLTDPTGHTCDTCEAVWKDIEDLVEEGAAEGKEMIRSPKVAGGRILGGAAVFYLGAMVSPKTVGQSDADEKAEKARLQQENEQNQEKEAEPKPDASGAGARQGGGRNEQKANQDRVDTAKDEAGKARKDLAALKSLPVNQRPANYNDLLKKAQGRLNRANSKARKSETHSRKHKG
jgi:RHS repeat-associated protein